MPDESAVDYRQSQRIVLHNVEAGSWTHSKYQGLEAHHAASSVSEGDVTWCQVLFS
jgi:hypothetical protein